MSSDFPLRAEDVIATVSSQTGLSCHSCGRRICGHEAVMSLVLGFKDAPRCLACLALDAQRESEELRQHVRGFVKARDCLAAGWRWADEEEASRVEMKTACCPPLEEAGQRALAGRQELGSATPATHHFDELWNAGDMGCGDLVLELRSRLRSMRAGQVLKVTARDPGAPEDLPAWCGLTGHRLVLASHPDYWIQRKET